MTHRQSRTSPRGRDSREGDRGFIMVAMLVSIAVAAVWMGALLPSWRQQAIREQEAELIFRGEQYARAIFLYNRKNNGALPQNIDQLVQQHYLRKKYLDPITGKDFVPIGGLAAIPLRQGGPAAPFAPAGISGVRSSSSDASIKIYYNQQIYSQWEFDWQTVQAEQEPGTSTTSPGIYQVLSASSGTGLDGTAYSTW